MPTDGLDLSLRRAEPDDATPVADLYSRARVAAVPLIIVGVVVAYLTSLGIEGRLGPPHDPKPRAGRAGSARSGMPPG